MSVVCKKCGAILRDSDVFCTECGTMVGDEVGPFIDDEDMSPYGGSDTADLGYGREEDGIRCPRCGEIMLPGSAFCTNCGAPLESDGGRIPDPGYDTDTEETVALEHHAPEYGRYPADDFGAGSGGYDYPPSDYPPVGYPESDGRTDAGYAGDRDVNPGEIYRPAEEYPSYPDDYPSFPESDYGPGPDYVGPDYTPSYDSDRMDGPGGGYGKNPGYSGEWSDPASFSSASGPVMSEPEAPKPKPALKGSLAKGFERKHKYNEGEYEKSPYFDKPGDL